MNPDLVLSIYLAILALYLLIDVSLTLLNLSSMRSSAGSVPSWLDGRIDGKTYELAGKYTTAKMRFSLVETVVEVAVLAAFTVFGVPGIVERAVVPIIGQEILGGALYIGCVGLLFRLIAIPEGVYLRFNLEERFGFNTMTPKTYAVDQLKGLLLALLIGAPALIGVLWLMSSTGRFWWLYAFGFVAVLQLVLGVLFPVLIAPLFNRFTPLEEGSLRDRLEALADSLGFERRGLYVMDGSRRSRHGNAYFTGFGKSRRIVLFDTLLETLSEPQIEAVLAHEIGHRKRRHIVKRTGALLLVMLAGFFCMDLLKTFEPLYRAFGFDSASEHALLALLLFFSGPVFYLLTPVFSALSRRHEYQADRYAAEAIGTASPLQDALLELGKSNLTSFTPHPLYSAVHYSHPTMRDRLEALEKV